GYRKFLEKVPREMRTAIEESDSAPCSTRSGTNFFILGTETGIMRTLGVLVGGLSISATEIKLDSIGLGNQYMPDYSKSIYQ
ncbi:MAG: hypothetical protein QXZ17_09630, partial [Nitrososphaerota archaeon]